MARKKSGDKKYLIFGIIVVAVVITVAIISLMKIGKSKTDDTLEGQVSENEGEIIECIEIETPYATLQFPEEWSNQIRIDTVEGDAYTVEFYGTVEGKEEMHLIDLIFGGTGGHTVGHLSVEGTEEPLAVNILYYDIEFGEEWEDDEKIEIQEMQGAVEYVMDRLLEMDGFELAD